MANVTRAGAATLQQPISAKNSAGRRRKALSEVSLDSMAPVGAAIAFVFAAVVGVTSRRGIQLLVIGIMLGMLPAVSAVSEKWKARQPGSEERNGKQRVQPGQSGSQMDWGCIGATSRTGLASRGPRGTAENNAGCSELTLALVALARREVLEASSQIDERKDRHGIESTTEPVGVDVHTGGD